MKQTVGKPSARRNFIGKLAGGVAAFGAASILPSNTFAGTLKQTNLVSDPAEIFKNLKGSQRIVVDAPVPHEIFPFAWPKVFLMTNEMTGVNNKDCDVVVVLRHSAIGYAMDNPVWAKYKLGEAFKANDPKTGKASLRNPFWKPGPNDFTVPGIGPVPLGINQLQENGVIFCVCDVAMTVNAAAIANASGMNAENILADFKSNLLPGIHVVPSGVWALGRAQQAGCGYIFAG